MYECFIHQEQDERTKRRIVNRPMRQCRGSIKSGQEQISNLCTHKIAPINSWLEHNTVELQWSKHSRALSPNRTADPNICRHCHVSPYIRIACSTSHFNIAIGDAPSQHNSWSTLVHSCVNTGIRDLGNKWICMVESTVYGGAVAEWVRAPGFI